MAADADGGYALRSGTSFAAPLVSGSLALLRQYFRGQLGNTELVTRLLATANRNGIYANSNTYGHGLVDLDAATAPVGMLMAGLPGTPGNHPLSGGIALSGGAFGASLSSALADVEIAGFDSLGAPFFQSAGRWVTRATRQPAGATHTTADMPLVAAWGEERRWQTGDSASRSPSLSLRMNNVGEVTAARLSLTNGWWFSHRHHGGQGLDLYAESVMRRFNAPLGFAAPYLSLVRDGPGLGWSNSLPGGGQLGFALMHGAPQFDGEEKPGGERGTGALLAMTMADTGLWLQAGAVREADGFLGATASGAFGQTSAATAFVGVNGSWAVGRLNDHSSGNHRWRVLASAYLGRTRPQVDDTALLRDVGDVLSSAFSLGAARASLWRRDDWLGLRLSQPLRVESGRMKLRVPAGRTKYGEVVNQDHDVSLAPSGRTLQVEAAYHFPAAGGTLQTGMGVERHPQHDRSEDMQPFMRLSFTRSF